MCVEKWVGSAVGWVDKMMVLYESKLWNSYHDKLVFMILLYTYCIIQTIKQFIHLNNLHKMVGALQIFSPGHILLKSRVSNPRSYAQVICKKKKKNTYFFGKIALPKDVI